MNQYTIKLYSISIIWKRYPNFGPFACASLCWDWGWLSWRWMAAWMSFLLHLLLFLCRPESQSYCPSLATRKPLSFSSCKMITRDLWLKFLFEHKKGNVDKWNRFFFLNISTSLFQIPSFAALPFLYEICLPSYANQGFLDG